MTLVARVWTAKDVNRLGIDQEVIAYLGDHGIPGERCTCFEVYEHEDRLRARVYRLNERGAIYADLDEIVSDVVEVPLKYRPTFPFAGTWI